MIETTDVNPDDWRRDPVVFPYRRREAPPPEDHIHISIPTGPSERRPNGVDDLWSSELPEHLRDDAPKLQCTACRRFTCATSELGQECRMPQPSGAHCVGRFVEV